MKNKGFCIVFFFAFCFASYWHISGMRQDRDAALKSRQHFVSEFAKLAFKRQFDDPVMKIEPSDFTVTTSLRDGPLKTSVTMHVSLADSAFPSPGIDRHLVRESMIEFDASDASDGRISSSVTCLAREIAASIKASKRAAWLAAEERFKEKIQSGEAISISRQNFYMEMPPRR